MVMAYFTPCQNFFSLQNGAGCIIYLQIFLIAHQVLKQMIAFVNPAQKRTLVVDGAKTSIQKPAHAVSVMQLVKGSQVRQPPAADSALGALKHQLNLSTAELSRIKPSKLPCVFSQGIVMPAFLIPCSSSWFNC